MSRKRYISTEISTDLKLAELAQYGLLPLLIYTWAIPHLDDWGRMNGDARQFKLTVCPALDVTTSDVNDALDWITESGLWMRYFADGKQVITIPAERWFKHQSYISKDKRNNDTGSNFKGQEYADEDCRKTPKNADEHLETPLITDIQRETAQSTASFSSSVSSSFSPSKTSSSSSSSKGENPFGLFETHKFGTLDDITREIIGDDIDEYTEEWVIRAIKEAVIQNVHTWSYVIKILKRWKETNHPEPWTLEKPEQPQGKVHQLNPRRGGYQQQSQKTKLPVANGKTNVTMTPEELEHVRSFGRGLAGDQGSDAS